jgi:hypothetical protein
MPVKDLGTKHICWKCGTKFYDLKKADPACPKCGADPRQAPVAKVAERRVRAKAPVETPEIEEKDLDEAIDDTDDEPEEDAGDDDEK